MSEDLRPTITRAGLAAVRNAQGTGLLAAIAAIGIGRGIASGSTFVGYNPAGTETALRDERTRVALLSGSKLGGAEGSDPIGFRVLAVVPPLAPGLPTYPVNEVGLYLDDGTLLCLWSDPTFPLSYMTGQASLEFAFDLFLSALPVVSMTITVQQPDIPDTTTVLAMLLATAANQFSASLADEIRRVDTKRKV